MMHVLVAVLWLLFGVVNAGLAFALFQRRWPRRRVVDFQNDRWIATTTILCGPVALAFTLVFLWRFGYYGWLWPWGHEALEESNLADPRAATGEGHRFGPHGMNKEHQCEYCGIELRVCCNPDCDWRGATTRMLGSIGPLCPVCDEVTEVVEGDVICGSYSTCPARNAPAC